MRLKRFKQCVVVVCVVGGIYWLGDTVQTMYNARNTQAVSLSTLQRETSDVSGLLTIEGTVVDYPVLRHATDDSYYLSHDIDHQKTPYGAIFMETVNAPDFSDAVTIVYGHAMKDGSMFGSLHHFLDPNFFDTYTTIRVQTAHRTKVYRIVSAHSHTTEHLYATYGLDNAQRVPTYLEEMLSTARQNGGLVRDVFYENQPILILSTCEDALGQTRLLVHAILESEVSH